MKTVKVKIIHDDLRESNNDVNEKISSFEMVLTKTGWFTFDGNWSCLPGYMKQTKGYFSQCKIGEFNVLYVQDKEDTLFGDDKQVMYMSLDSFTDSPKVGMKGKGSVYQLGAKGAPLFTSWGKVSSFIRWKITEVN